MSSFECGLTSRVSRPTVELYVFRGSKRLPMLHRQWPSRQCIAIIMHISTSMTDDAIVTRQCQGPALNLSRRLCRYRPLFVEQSQERAVIGDENESHAVYVLVEPSSIRCDRTAPTTYGDTSHASRRGLAGSKCTSRDYDCNSCLLASRMKKDRYLLIQVPFFVYFCPTDSHSTMAHIVLLK